MFSLIKTLFSSSLSVSNRERRFLLFLCASMIILNFWGTWRNSKTLWMFQDAMSRFWLALDITQLIYCSMLFGFIYSAAQLPQWFRTTLFITSSVFLLTNIYNFIVNFSYLPKEGLFIFVMWFINNSGMVLISAVVAYFIISHKMWLQSQGCRYEP
jgi:hypothetical protein